MVKSQLKLFIKDSWSTVTVEEVKTVDRVLPPWLKGAPGWKENQFYKVFRDVSSGKKYFGIYNQNIDANVVAIEEKVCNASQSIPTVISTFSIKSDEIITEFLEYYPMIITLICNYYGEEKYIERARAHYCKFKMPTTEDILGEDNLKHLDVDHNYEANREQLYQKVLQTHRDFHVRTNCFFSDIESNNVLVNDDFTDYRVIDIASLKYGDYIDIDGHQPFPVPIDRIIGPAPGYKYLHSI